MLAEDIFTLSRYQSRKTKCQYARCSLKIPTGTESVENEFNFIPLNQAAKPGGLGAKKLRRMMHCIGNYDLLKNWW